MIVQRKDPLLLQLCQGNSNKQLGIAGETKTHFTGYQNSVRRDTAYTCPEALPGYQYGSRSPFHTCCSHSTVKYGLKPVSQVGSNVGEK